MKNYSLSFLTTQKLVNSFNVFEIWCLKEEKRKNQQNRHKKYINIQKLNACGPCYKKNYLIQWKLFKSTTQFILDRFWDLHLFKALQVTFVWSTEVKSVAIWLGFAPRGKNYGFCSQNNPRDFFDFLFKPQNRRFFCIVRKGYHNVHIL